MCVPPVRIYGNEGGMMMNSEARKRGLELEVEFVSAPSNTEADKAFGEYVTIRQDLILGRVEDLMATFDDQMAEMDELLEKFRNLQALR